ncbi:MAG: DUF6062 family protein, partial [Chloroflexota bacterium]
MSNKPGKHTPFFELVDAQGQSGCPICRLIFKSTYRYLDGVLYEAVLDPGLRTKLKLSRGFCETHVAMLHDMPGRSLGIALIYRDVIRALAEIGERERFQPRPRQTWFGRLRRRAPWRQPVMDKLAARKPCPACAAGLQAEKAALEMLIAHLGDERLASAYAQGEGLCLKHLLRALEAVEDEATFERLVCPQAQRYRRMLADLDEFIRKRDHRFRL